MKNRKKIILILLILGLFFIALTTVNAEDNSTATLNQPNINNVEIYEEDSSTDIDESNQNSKNIVKNDYNSVKNYYKKHLHDINLKLPYYLKSLEILIQHYTVPVAITRSLEQAPEMFKPGLRELIASIDSGDSTIEPYMAFARRYPVRDSMRMMRLLYRLSLGSQERKQEQLIVFSRTISNLQAKSRDTKYKERLEKMEKKTMTMFTATGAGVMIILVLSIMQQFTAM